MTWRDELRVELHRAREAERLGNMGRVRTSVRRAVGHAITEWQRRDPGVRWGRDFLRQLHGLSMDPTVPGEVRGAAERLGSRLGKDFQSRSETPMEDARTILTYVLDRMGEPPDLS